MEKKSLWHPFHYCVEPLCPLQNLCAQDWIWDIQFTTLFSVSLSFLTATAVDLFSRRDHRTSSKFCSPTTKNGQTLEDLQSMILNHDLKSNVT
jgi:hypothetical protein